MAVASLLPFDQRRVGVTIIFTAVLMHVLEKPVALFSSGSPSTVRRNSWAISFPSRPIYLPGPFSGLCSLPPIPSSFTAVGLLQSELPPLSAIVLPLSPPTSSSASVYHPFHYFSHSPALSRTVSAPVHMPFHSAAGLAVAGLRCRSTEEFATHASSRRVAFCKSCSFVRHRGDRSRGAGRTTESRACSPLVTPSLADASSLRRPYCATIPSSRLESLFGPSESFKPERVRCRFLSSSTQRAIPWQSASTSISFAVFSPSLLREVLSSCYLTLASSNVTARFGVCAPAFFRTRRSIERLPSLGCPIPLASLQCSLEEGERCTQGLERAPTDDRCGDEISTPPSIRHSSAASSPGQLLRADELGTAVLHGSPVPVISSSPPCMGSTETGDSERPPRRPSRICRSSFSSVGPLTISATSDRGTIFGSSFSSVGSRRIIRISNRGATNPDGRGTLDTPGTSSSAVCATAISSLLTPLGPRMLHVVTPSPGSDVVSVSSWSGDLGRSQGGEPARPTALNSAEAVVPAVSPRVYLISDASTDTGAREDVSSMAMHAHHNRRRSKLSRPHGHRRCLLRNLCTELLRHGAITTTYAKAKECKRSMDKLVMLAKEPSLHTYRQALSHLYDKRLTRRLLLEVWSFSPGSAVRAGGHQKARKAAQLGPQRFP
ncbi:50s ribosomal protein l17, partial [Cystoisospora suis]